MCMGSCRPYVILNAAMTLDGKIASTKGDSSISSKKDLTRVHRLRGTVDAILVGINTVLTDNPILVAKYRTRNPTRIIIDSKARINSRTKVMHTCKNIPTIIAVSNRASRLNLKKIRSLGASVFICGKNQVDLKKLLIMLKDKGINKVLVEGGGEINWSMLRAGLVDEIMVTVAPKIVGGRNAITLVEGMGFPRINNCKIKLKLEKIKKIEDEVVLSYKIMRANTHLF